MAQTVEQIAELIGSIKNENAKIISKVDELNQNAEVNEILKVSLPKLEKVIEEQYNASLEKAAEIKNSVDTLLANNESLSTSEEIKELFSTLKTDINNFYGEITNQHAFIESLSQKISEISEDKTDKDDIIENISVVKGCLENFNHSLEVSVININSNLQTILKNLMTMDTTEQNDIIKRELENIYLTSNAILSSLEISDRKDEDLYNIISSVESKINDLLDIEHSTDAQHISALKSDVEDGFEKTFSEISKIETSFKNVSSYNLEQILSNIENSSSKIDELNTSIREDFANNISAIKGLVENISIDAPSVNPENPALSGKLEEILNLIKSIPVENTASFDITGDVKVLKESLSSISELLNNIKFSDNGIAAEKLVSLEVAVSESLRHYDDNIIALNNKLNEYISSIYKLGEITDTKLESSLSGITDVKFELKNVIEILNSLNLKSDAKIDEITDNVKLNGENLNQRIEDINNALRINTDYLGNKFENINEMLDANSHGIVSKVEDVNISIHEKLIDVNETLKNNVEVVKDNFINVNTVLDNKLNEINESVKDNVGEVVGNKFENINIALSDKIGIINEALINNVATVSGKVDSINNVLTAKIEEVNSSIKDSVGEVVGNKFENINTALNDKIGIINEALINNVTTVSGKVDSINNVLTEKIEEVNASIKDNVGEVVVNKFENINAEIGDKIALVNEALINNVTTVSGKVDGINNTLSEKIDEVNSALKLDVDSLRSCFDSALSALDIVRKDVLNSASNNKESLIEIINAAITEIKSAVLSNNDANTSVLLIKDRLEDVCRKFDEYEIENNKTAAERFSRVVASMEDTASKIEVLNSDISRQLYDYFSSHKETFSALLLEFQARQEELINNVKLESEKNVLSFDNLTVSIKGIENTLEAKAVEYREQFEEKISELKEYINAIKQVLASDDESYDEKIFNKLFSVEAMISDASDKYEEKIVSLNASLANYIQSVQKSAEDTEIRLGNSLSEISEIKADLQNVLENINTVENAQDIKFYEVTENVNSKIEDVITNISGIKELVQSGLREDFKENILVLDKKFDNLFNCFADLQQFSPETIDTSLTDIIDKVAALKQEISLVNTDMIEALDAKTASILEQFEPVKEAVGAILEFDFSRIITEVKTQVELSYLNLSSDLNSSLTLSQEAISKLEQVFRDISRKIDSIDEQVTEFTQNNLEVLSLTIENINRVVESNLDATNTLSDEWKDGIAQLEEKIVSAGELSADSVKLYIDEFQTGLYGKLNTNLEEVKSFISLHSGAEDVLHSLDILKSEMTTRFDVFLDGFRKEIEKSDEKNINLQVFSTDLKSYIDKILVNFAKHIESSFAKDNVTNENLMLLFDTFKTNLSAEISQGLEKISEEVIAIRKSNEDYNVEYLNSMLNETSGKIKAEIVAIDKKVSDTLQALHDKVDILAMFDDSKDDIIEEIEDIKSLLTDANADSPLGNLLSEINRIEESSSKNVNDIKESVMSAIISVFDQISFVEESEDIKDFVEEKTDEINQNLIEVRNQLKQLGYSDSFDYSYTLQDVETDIAKLRMVLNEISQSSSGVDMSELSDNIHRIVGSIDGLQSSLTTDQIYDLKSDIERLNEDMLSISTRTNKLLLTSDESYKALSNGLDDFSKVIFKLEERINYLDDTETTSRIEKKVDYTNSMVASIANSNKVMHQVMMYLGEWIDTTSENISAISERTSEIDEIREIITDLKSSVPSKAVLLNELENRFEEQQQRIDRLEMKFDRMLSVLEDRDDSRLNKKIDRIEKQMTKLSMNIEKLASYVDE